MSDDARVPVSEADREALWSMLVGEVSPAEERALRDRIAREPELTLALEELEQTRDAVRSLRDEPVTQATIESMRTGLAARIAASERAGGGLAASTEPRADVRRIDAHPAFRRWAGPLAAALAAGLALAVYVGLQGDRSAPSLDLEGMPIADARDDGTGGGVSVEDDRMFAEASEEEIAIALSYDVLSDYEVIEQLDLLEQLVAMEAGGRI